MKMNRRKIIAAVSAVGIVVTLAACSGDSQYDATHDDSGYRGRDYTEKDLIMMPDGFPNIASVCDPYTDGVRLYVGTRKDGATSVVVPFADPSCKKDMSHVNMDKSYQSPDQPHK
jgi:hypothetical protein